MQNVITGKTSNTGNRVVERLIQKVGTESITCLVRPTSNIAFLKEHHLALHVCDITEPESFRELLNPSTIYLDMTHPKHYDKSLEAVIKSGVERAYFITTTGIFSQYNQFSHIYKINEDKIRASGITYTILRPSMIYGSLQDKNMNRLIRFLNRYPVFPLFGAGRSLMQPVFVDDLADGIVSVIGNSATENQEYNLAGPEGISYRQIIDTILGELNSPIKLLNIPLPLAANAAKVAQHIPGFPVTHEQVLRLMEDKVFDIGKAQAELAYSPRSFADGIVEEIAQMRTAGII
jgi:nucleoside-diphosphate-sugar epimerase